MYRQRCVTRNALIFGFLFCFSALAADNQKAGLLLIAHGSHSETWNNTLREIGDKVEAKLDRSLFDGVEVAFMELSEPSIAQAVKGMERDRYARIIAVPLFMLPSAHCLFDIPAILGHYHDCRVTDNLRREGIALVDSHIPITLTSTLSASGTGMEILVDRLKALSVNPREEAIVLLVHGSDLFAPQWERFCSRFAALACARTGISYCDWAQVGVGQKFESSGIPVIHEAAANRRRVILIGGYMALSAQRILDRYVAKNAGRGHLEEIDIVAADTAVLPDDRIVEWILQSASSALSD